MDMFPRLLRIFMLSVVVGNFKMQSPTKKDDLASHTKRLLLLFTRLIHEHLGSILQQTMLSVLSIPPPNPMPPCPGISLELSCDTVRTRIDDLILLADRVMRRTSLDVHRDEYLSIGHHIGHCLHLVRSIADCRRIMGPCPLVDVHFDGLFNQLRACLSKIRKTLSEPTPYQMDQTPPYTKADITQSLCYIYAQLGCAENELKKYV